MPGSKKNESYYQAFRKGNEVIVAAGNEKKKYGILSLSFTFLRSHFIGADY